MTKQQQILAMLDAGWRPRAIAAVLGCHVAYVRVAQQRRHGKSVADRNWVQKCVAEHGVHPWTIAYRTNPELRERHKARVRAYRLRKLEQAHVS